MQALILAAGMGKRLGNLIQDGTKCMLRVNGKSLIERTIEQLVANKISRLVIVTGCKSNVLKNFIASKFDTNNLGEMEIEYIENPDYATTNNIYSLYLAREELKKSDTILIESDLIFRQTLFPALIESPYKNVAVVSAWEDWMERLLH
ncbi:MAG: phosphocholine cytidylyltransferase family protein [Treponema sp.]|nr:phosphocholine cytidylyltransferase family protein [Treponema sp.]